MMMRYTGFSFVVIMIGFVDLKEVLKIMKKENITKKKNKYVNLDGLEKLVLCNFDDKMEEFKIK